MPSADERPLYQPFWCEENIWHLAADPVVGGGERAVVIITGVEDLVACCSQQAAHPGQQILWDYHVVLAVNLPDQCLMWDLDTTLALPVPAGDWLAATFPIPDLVPKDFQPRFAVITADDFRRDFTSDRQHMRAADGSWLKPPPAWPAITQGRVSLIEYIAQARRGLDLAAIQQQLNPIRR